MDTGYDVAAFQAAVADRRLSALEAENQLLRACLSEAAWLAEDGVEHCRRDPEPGDPRRAGADRPHPEPRPAEIDDRDILASTTDVVTMLDLDGRLAASGGTGPVPPGAAPAPFAAVPLAALVGRSWIEAWPAPESRAVLGGALDAARAGRPCRVQAAWDADGRQSWWDVAVTPVRGADGRPARILAVSRDITDLKRNEARQTLHMQELAHRVKNTLALVQAVATQTLRNAGSLEQAGRALDARLVALAQAHDVLVQGAWASASLAGLVAGAVALHGDGVPGRFAVDGPDVMLDARHGLTLALMLHELATNAAKYGALSTAAGRVVIAWDVAGSGAGACLRFRWEEIGGPPVLPPTRSGFGTRLIARSLSHDFGGAVSLAFPPTGAVLTLEAPLAQVVAA